MSTCPRCGEENSDGARFCSSCGLALERTRAPGEERKVVSVLFVDLVGFTDSADQADPEDVRATLRPYHARLKQEIERFGGTLEKFIGDAVMAVFGAPVVHEDDPERAISAGLRILDAIEELNDSRSLELAVRAAVNTGEAVVSLGARAAEGDSLVAGDVVNTAARLQTAAPVGALVVGEASYRATRHLFEYEPLEPVAVKGKAEPVRLWRAVAARRRLGAELPRPRTPFVGRDGDFTLLKSIYARAMRESSLQVVTVTGEPGVGKTRLVEELRAFVDDQPELVFWRQGRCPPYGEGITYWALGEMVKGQAGILESDSPDEAAGKLEVAVDAVTSDPTERDWLRARLAPLVGAEMGPSPAPEQQESFTAWRGFLEGIAATRPLILVFEDLHWADEALLAFLDHLVEWSSGVSLVVICTARPELYERHRGWGGGKRNSSTISLSPLAIDETARLLSALLSQAALPAPTQAALLERCGGNPLYAEEFVRMLTDTGLLSGGALVATEGEIPVPETVQALIAARLDTLTTEDKGLLWDAAVVGKVFWAGAIASMRELDETAVREGLHELEQKELVRRARSSSVSDQSEYSFWHLLVRDVAYGQIPRADRARKHERAGRWIEGIAGERVTDHAELLAYHYEQALELARASGELEEAKRLEEPTRRFLVMAGERTASLHFPKAESYYRRAIALSADDALARARILLTMSGVLSNPAEMEEALEESVALFRAAPDELGLSEALVELGRAVRLRGQTARGREMFAEADRILERYPPGRSLALARAQEVGVAMIEGRVEDTLAGADEALALAERFGLPDQAARVVQFRGAARSRLGDREGLADISEALRQCLELGISGPAVGAYTNLAHATWELDSAAAALELERTAVDFAESRGNPNQAMWARAESAWMLYDLGEWDELLRVTEIVAEFDRRVGGGQHGLIALPYRTLVLLRRGELDDASRLLAELLPRAISGRDGQVLVPSLAVAAFVEEARGDLQAAVARISELAKQTRDRAKTDRARFLPELVELALASGARELAHTLLEGLNVEVGRLSHSVVAARAVLAETDDRIEEGLDLHLQAAARWEEYGSVPGRALALLGAGRTLLALGRASEAEARLKEARELFDALAARPWIARVDDRLSEATTLSA